MLFSWGFILKNVINGGHLFLFIDKMSESNQIPDMLTSAARPLVLEVHNVIFPLDSAPAVQTSTWLHQRIKEYQAQRASRKET